MNDFEFGNYLFSLRKALKLSQEKLANILGVTNKAVSKWENGKCKPEIKQLKKLSKIFNVSIEDLLNKIEEKEENKIIKICVTGGPCAGKSTALSYIQNEFTQKGYGVLFVPETATELILGGIAPWTMENENFQETLLKLQLYKEKLYEESAKKLYKNKKVLIVCDRGALDGKAFSTDLEFENMLNKMDLTENFLRDNYDAVFHLVTSAKGAENCYTLSNNKARTETIQEAKEKDEKLIKCYTGHPHLRIIENFNTFEEKMNKLINEISLFLGEPEHLEIERKFLIKKPDVKQLLKHENCKKIEIIQTYLKSNDEELRIRQRGENGNFTYTKTVKKKIYDIKRYEVEKRLTEKEYLNLLLKADPNKKQIRKTRYCLLHNNQYFEIDFYPEWEDYAIMEIELNNINQEVKPPKFIEIIKEVTNDDNYKNSNLANI